MSCPLGPHRPFFTFGNPFRIMKPKGSMSNPTLLSLLNTFEETLAERLRKIFPNRDDILSLSWMRLATKSLCDIHRDMKTLIRELELPVSDWDDKWINVYLNDSVKLLDICIAFSSEISRLNQSHLFLQCALHSANSASSKKFLKASSSSLDSWRRHISSKNPKLGNFCTILDDFIESLDLLKVKNSAKGKVLMRAIYGVKVSTAFLCSVFVAAFSASSKNLIDLRIPDTFLWAEAFTVMQSTVNGELRDRFSKGSNPILRELEAIEWNAKCLHSTIQDGVGSIEAEVVEKSILGLREDADKLRKGLDLLAKEVDRFFQIILADRDALLCNLRGSGTVS